MDAHIAADDISVLITNRDNTLYFLRSLEMQQRQAAIKALGDRVPFKNVDPFLQIVCNGLFIESREVGPAGLVCPELNMVENLLQIVSRGGGIDFSHYGLAVV